MLTSQTLETDFRVKLEVDWQCTLYGGYTEFDSFMFSRSVQKV